MRAAIVAAGALDALAIKLQAGTKGTGVQHSVMCLTGSLVRGVSSSKGRYAAKLSALGGVDGLISLLSDGTQATGALNALHGVADQADDPERARAALHDIRDMVDLGESGGSLPDGEKAKLVARLRGALQLSENAPAVQASKAALKAVRPALSTLKRGRSASDREAAAERLYE
eukprot:5875579-Prymnesium_polylepis.1